MDSILNGVRNFYTQDKDVYMVNFWVENFRLSEIAKTIANLLSIGTRRMVRSRISKRQTNGLN
jgi:hypothetical protein